MIIPFVSVVILNFNGRKCLGGILDDCLASALNADYPNFEVLFVDNASTDDSVAYVKKTFSNYSTLRVIQNEKNLGFTEGNNRGIRASNGKFIALLNSDTRVDADWLKELVKAAQNPEVGAVQSKLLIMNAARLLDSAGGLVDYHGYHFEIGRGKPASAYSQPREIFYAKGASVLLKRETLLKSGLFDPDIFMYFDEVDLCWRILLSGFRVVYAPSSVVYHASGSTASVMQQKLRTHLYARNHLMILLKNYNLSNAFKSVTVSVLFEIRNMVFSMARRRPLIGIAILKALLWNLRRLKRIWIQRQIVQCQIRRVDDEKIRQRMLAPYPPFPLYLVFPRSRYQQKPMFL